MTPGCRRSPCLPSHTIYFKAGLSCDEGQGRRDCSENAEDSVPISLIPSRPCDQWISEILVWNSWWLILFTPLMKPPVAFEIDLMGACKHNCAPVPVPGRDDDVTSVSQIARWSPPSKRDTWWISSSQRGGMINVLPRSAHQIAASIALTSVFLLSFVAAVLGQDDTGQINVTALTLEVGTPIERDLARDDHHRYRINLNAGQYGRLVVIPQAVDVAVFALGAGGNQIMKIESPYGAQEPVFVSLLGNESGSYQVEVLSTEQGALNGHYKIDLDEVRPATVLTEILLECQRTFAAGQSLREKGTSESKQSALRTFEQAGSILSEDKQSQGRSFFASSTGWFAE